MSIRSAITLALLASLISPLAGCSGRAWKAARGEDTVVAYHRFLETHPDGEYSAEARARLEMARVRKRPTRAAYQQFRAEHADPALLAELRPHVEEAFFRHARALGTAGAFETFLEDFPEGQFSQRAQGNAAYLREGGFRANPEALARFAEAHPESDFAAEAQRSAAAVTRRGESDFRRVGVLTQVAADTPGAERLARAFLERAAAAYQRAGLEVVSLGDESQIAPAKVQAVLRILHQERPMGSELEAGTVTQPSIVARTEVILNRVGQEQSIWSDVFEYRSPLASRREEVSILFGPGAQAGYWSDLDGQFFVPVARWDNQTTIREPQDFSRPAVGVEVGGNRAVVLFGEGDFEVFDLGDPSRPVRLGEFRRERDLSHFHGVSLAGNHVAVFGEDGVELVLLEGTETRRQQVFGRDVVGSALAVESVQGTWVAATNRGLLELGADSSKARMLLQRPIPGMDRMGERLVFTDGVSLYVATLELLRSGRVESELRLGRGFAPRRVRVHGTTAVVLGERDAVWVDLRRPNAPRLLSRIGGNESGRVRDAAVVGNRLFLLGPRGLQVADPSGERIVDSIDVSARERIEVSGRHLVMIGAKRLQVVDTTPYVSSSAAARER